jgi:hypothetical protein
MVDQKSEGKQDADVWNSAQPYFGNTLSTTFGTHVLTQATCIT